MAALRIACRSVAAAGLLAIAAGAPPAQAQSACPSGYRFQMPASCVSIRAPTCPRGYHLIASRRDCVSDTSRPQTHVPSCAAGYTFRRAQGDCYSTRPASCPGAKRIEPRTGRCVTGVVQ